QCTVGRHRAFRLHREFRASPCRGATASGWEGAIPVVVPSCGRHDPLQHRRTRDLSPGDSQVNDFFRTCREAAARGVTRVPLTRDVVLDSDTPVSAFHKLHCGDYGFLLESLEGGERWARYSFLSTEPATIYRYRGDACEVSDRDGAWRAHCTQAPLPHL